MSTAIASTLTMATPAMPLTSVLASSATRSSVNWSGSSRTHCWARSPTSLSRSQPPTSGSSSSWSTVVGQLFGELPRLGHRPRTEHQDEQGGERHDADGDDGDGEAASHVEALLQHVDERVEGEGDEDADADRG